MSRCGHSAPVDGFRLAYGRFGTTGAPAVVLLHGWPGNRHDHRLVVPILGDVADVIVADLRGFGGSDKHAVAVRHFYSATAQAASIVGLIRELGLSDAVRDYLRHFWTHWSGPHFALSDDDLDRLVADYALPGAFTTSIAWYPAGAGTVAQSLSELPPERAVKIRTPTAVLWPRHDPLYPTAWADRLAHYFTDVDVQFAEGVGHFTPLETPDEFAEMVLVCAAPGRSR